VAALSVVACFDSGGSSDDRAVAANTEISNSGSGMSNSKSEISNARSEISGESRDSLEQININDASAEELQRLPHIGPVVASKIIEYRDKFGPFKRVEELMMIDGMSDARFRRIRSLIRVK